MSYIRWFDSDWYIFRTHSLNPKNKNEETLAVWYITDERLPCFTYKQLKKIKTITNLKNLLQLNIPNSAYKDCLKYIKLFIKEVDEEYKVNFSGGS